MSRGQRTCPVFVCSKCPVADAAVAERMSVCTCFFVFHACKLTLFKRCAWFQRCRAGSLHASAARTGGATRASDTKEIRCLPRLLLCPRGLTRAVLCAMLFAVLCDVKSGTASVVDRATAWLHGDGQRAGYGHLSWFNAN